MKTVLVIVPFQQIYPPMSGGMQRCFNILHQLSRYFAVTAIMHQKEAALLQAAEYFPAIKNVKVISTADVVAPKDLFSLLPSKLETALRFRFWKRTLFQSADSDFLRIYPILTGILKKKKFDIAILDNLSSLKLASVIRKEDPDCRLVYNSYNIDTHLAEAEFRKGLISKLDVERTRKAESGMYREVNEIIACSKADLDEMVQMNHHRITGEVIPNGVFIPGKELPPSLPDPGDRLLFCGSLDYYPNREGLLWFCKEIFPLILKNRPFCRLAVVGKGDAGSELNKILKHPSIDNYGRVEEVNSYYRMSKLAVVPLLSGSGTRLKILEAMGQGTPVVSTSKGAEGINYVSGENILIADEESAFANAVLNLLENDQLAKSLSTRGFQLMLQQYDWNVIGEKLKDFLEK